MFGGFTTMTAKFDKAEAQIERDEFFKFLLLQWQMKMKYMETCWKEIKKKKIEIRLFNTSYRMQCCSLVLPEHLWPFCGSLASWGETTGPIYWQAHSWENTISWQKTSHPEQTAHFYIDIHNLPPPRPWCTPCLSLFHSGNVFTFSADLPHVHAGGSHACHYPA